MRGTTGGKVALCVREHRGRGRRASARGRSRRPAVGTYDTVGSRRVGARVIVGMEDDSSLGAIVTLDVRDIIGSRRVGTPSRGSLQRPQVGRHA